jgi:hypothetical protein
MTCVCALCGATGGPADLALDLGLQPSMRHYPSLSDPLPDPTHPLALWVCPGCGLAQLVADDTDEPEVAVRQPTAVADQARQAVDDLADELMGRLTVRAFPSPHGDPAVDAYVACGLTLVDGVADVVADSFGIMHDADQAGAFAARAAAVAPGGLLVLTVQPLDAIVATGQWTAVRHGHIAYYSLTALRSALEGVGLVPVRVTRYALYGGTAVVVAERDGEPDEALQQAYEAEARAQLTTPAGLSGLQHEVRDSVERLAGYLRARAADGTRLYGYGAPSRVTSLLAAVGDAAHAITAIADAAPSKQGLALPVSRIPVISPAELVAADADEVLLMLDDLYDEVLAAYPSLTGRLTRLPRAVADA